MSEWRDVPLRDLCHSVQYGVTASAAKDRNEGPRLLRITDIVPPRIDWESVPVCDLPETKIAKYQLHQGDIVVARSGSVGYAKLVDHPPRRAVFASYLVRFQVQEGIDSRYVGQVVQSTAYREFVIAHAGGAAQPNANAKTLGAFPVPIPTLPTQRRIAAVLSTFDELIEINQRRIELLEDLARSLYREWFVRFRFPGHEDATFVDSTRGEIPERWTVRRLDAIAAIIMGQSPKSEFYNEIGEGLPFHQGVADYGDLLPTHRKYCTLESRTADAMDLLCSVRAPVGRLNLADERLVIGRGLSGIRRVDHNQALLLEQLRSPLGEEDSLGSGTIFKAINKEQLGGLPIVEPAADIGSAFELTARPMLDERVQRTLQNRQLATTRDLLLPRLVTGRLDISHIDLGELLPPEPA